MMNIAIVGGRDLEDYEILKMTLNSYIKNKNRVSAIVSSGAKRADTLAKRYSEVLGTEMMVYRPNFEKYENSATLERNILIIENSDVAFAFGMANPEAL